MKQVLVSALVILAFSGKLSAKPSAKPVQNLYDSCSDVVALSVDNFDMAAHCHEEVWVVQFYAPWCSHSQEIVQEFCKAATALKGNASVGVVDDDVRNDPLHDNYNIKGYPTVLILHGKEHHVYTEYPLTSEGLIKRVMEIVQQDSFTIG